MRVFGFEQQRDDSVFDIEALEEATGSSDKRVFLNDV